MSNLVISKEFTIDDIHKIREYNYEMTKNMTPEERKRYYNSKAEKVRAEIKQLRKNKQKTGTLLNVIN